MSATMNPHLSDKHQTLVNLLHPMKRLVVAFSGGVDSTLVLKVALETLGKENVLAATGVSPSLPQRELHAVQALADALDAPLELLRTSEMDRPGYVANAPNRCYFCKTELYSRLSDLAKVRSFPTIANGINTDDTGDWRPGIQAAREWNIRAPLLEARMGKADVRALAEALNLPNAQKPALACLSSRIPYGTPVTLRSLSQIEKAEDFLYARGFEGFRVRHHGNLARIELNVQDIPRLTVEPLRSELIAYCQSLGYTYITLDLAGFRSGSGNEVLKAAPTQPADTANVI